MSRILSLILLFTFPLATFAGEPKRPNVILFFSDDQGSIDVGCYGSKDLHTPNLDSLAKRGVRFTQFYVASPVCSPSRGALLTGRYPQRNGITGNVSSRPGNSGLAPSEVTIAEMLRGAGYRTAIVGKWHLGTDAKHDPLAQGFQQFFGHKAGCIDNYSHFFYWRGPPLHDLWRNRTEIWENGKHFSDLIVRESTKFIEQNKDRPFFLYVPFNIPHYPLQAARKFQKMYDHLKEPRRAYAALVTHLDAAIGQILAKVDQLNLRDNTFVIFLSDHGHSTEERNNFGGGNAGRLRGAKFSLFEGGVRVPCIISWPGNLPQGETRDQTAISLDILPTIADLCSVQPPKRKIDGKRLTPLLRSAKAKTPHHVLHWQLGKQWAVREGDWKLVINGRPANLKMKLPKADRVFLSNLSKDDSERNNLAQQHPDVVQRLTRLHQEWIGQFGK